MSTKLSTVTVQQAATTLCTSVTDIAMLAADGRLHSTAEGDICKRSLDAFRWKNYKMGAAGVVCGAVPSTEL